MRNERLNKLLMDLLILPIWRFFDFVIPKNKHYWGFPVHHIKTDQFIENSRAVFEEIKADENIIKIIFARNDNYYFDIIDAKNTIIVKLKSIKGLSLLLRCKVLFVTHSISMDYSLRWGNKLFSVVKLNMKKRLIINLWHGIALKKLYSLWNPLVKERLDRVSFRHKERKYYKGLIVSSAIDSYAMATMFYPIKYENIWVTGLPRNDFLIKNLNDLPAYLSSQVNTISQIKRGRRLITYAPTYRQTAAVKDSYYYQFSNEEIDKLKEILIKHNAVFGFRTHYFRNNKNLFNIEKFIDDEYIFDLGHSNFSEIASVIRESDLIITDYSSVYIDALYLNKPVFCFAYDLEHYRDNQDGLLYDLDIAFPGAVVSDYQSLMNELDKELTKNTQTDSVKYKISQKMFFEYIDDKNTDRIIKKIKKLLSGVSS